MFAYSPSIAIMWNLIPVHALANKCSAQILPYKYQQALSYGDFCTAASQLLSKARLISSSRVHMLHLSRHVCIVLLHVQVLFMHMDALRAMGRRVVLVGDLNIAPAAIDSCDPGTGAEFTAWLSRRDRAFLRSHLQPHGGAYVDIFRTFHPDR